MRRRSYFIKESVPAVHLHIFEDTDPEEIKVYSDLKKELLTRSSNDRQRYTLEKLRLSNE